MRWEKLTSREIGALDRSIPVILNIAAIEQHGPHLPLDTDARIGAHFLGEFDARDPDRALILPPVVVCASEHHMDFPGTLTVRHATLLAYVTDILNSVAAHGFRNILLFNSHGGNQAIGQVVVESFGSRHRDCRIGLLTWWRIAAEALAEVQGGGFGSVGHACEFETSLMLHIDEGSVRRELIPGPSHVMTHGWANNDLLRSGRGSLFRTMAEISGGSGVVGDPSLASAEKGRAITRIVVDALTEIVATMK
ncbi:creatininase family protein [Microvirga lenta]|uniref:creatininase family protein n=1 Tax=Microvirga lenta TaxID=2881337 RepID=UPI001CFFF130|nr:creatininase family protein [Microvirga lenta]MCB5175084.1 creatininase family protein [Microvirga lenta]